MSDPQEAATPSDPHKQKTTLWVGDMPKPEDVKLGLDSNGNPVYSDGDYLNVMVPVLGIKDIRYRP